MLACTHYRPLHLVFHWSQPLYLCSLRNYWEKSESPFSYHLMVTVNISAKVHVIWQPFHTWHTHPCSLFPPICIYSWCVIKGCTLVQNNLSKTIQDHPSVGFDMQKEGFSQYNKILKMHVMFTNKESSTNMLTMCLSSLKVAVSSSFRSLRGSLTQSLFWSEKKFNKTCESIVTLSSLYHLLPHCSTSSQSDSIVFYYITFYNIKPLSVIFHPRPQNQCDTLIGPSIIPIPRLCSCYKWFCHVQQIHISNTSHVNKHLKHPTTSRFKFQLD